MKTAISVHRKGIATLLVQGFDLVIPDVGDSLDWKEGREQWYGRIGDRLFKYDREGSLEVTLVIANGSDHNTYRRFA